MKLKIILIFLCAVHSLNISAQVPSLIWVNPEDGGNSITVDNNGNITVINSSAIKRLDSTGYIIWNKKINDSMGSGSIDSDSDGNLYSVGSFYGLVNFGDSIKPYWLNAKQSRDVFVTKQDSNGTLSWAKKMGGIFEDYGYGIAVGDNGEVATTGSFEIEGDFNPNEGEYILPNPYNMDKFPYFSDNDTWNYLSGIGIDLGGWNEETRIKNWDVFISTLSSGGEFIRAKSIWGEKDDRGRAVAFDSIGNLFATGFFQGNVRSNEGDATFTLSSDSSNGIYITRYDKYLNLKWGKGIENVGSGNVVLGYTARRIAIDNSGNVYIAGCFEGTVDFNPSAENYLLTSNGGIDAFILKLDSNGDFIWVKQIGAELDDKAFNIDIDKNNDLIISGYFGNTVDFDPNNEHYNLTSKGEFDNFILKLNSVGQFCWVADFGIPKQELSFECDNSNNIVVSGYFDGLTDFDPSTNSFELTPTESKSYFTLKLTNPSEQNLAPIDIVLSSNSISEFAEIGSTIGLISTIDDDNNFLYSFVEGDGDSDNNHFTLNGDSLLLNTVVDYEQKSEYSILVQTKDPDGSVFQKKLIVYVENHNEFQFTFPSEIKVACDSDIPNIYKTFEEATEEGAIIASDCKIINDSFSWLGDTTIMSPSIYFKKYKLIERTYSLMDSCGNISIATQHFRVSYYGIINIRLKYDYNQISDIRYLEDYYGLSFSTLNKVIGIEQFKEIAEIYPEDECKIHKISYYDRLDGICPLKVTRYFEITDILGNVIGYHSQYFTDNPWFPENQWNGDIDITCPPQLEINDIPEIPEAITNVNEFREHGGNINGSFSSINFDSFVLLEESIDTLENYWEIQRTYSIGDYCGNVSTCARLIKINNSVTDVGITVENQFNLEVYPNPNNGNFTLDLSGIDGNTVWVDIIKSSGENILHKEILTEISTINKQINLTGVAKGVYHISIKDDRNVVTKSLVIR